MATFFFSLSSTYTNVSKMHWIAYISSSTPILFILEVQHYIRPDCFQWSTILVLHWYNIDCALEIFTLKCQYYSIIDFTVEIFARKYQCLNIYIGNIHQYCRNIFAFTLEMFARITEIFGFTLKIFAIRCPYGRNIGFMLKMLYSRISL